MNLSEYWEGICEEIDEERVIYCFANLVINLAKPNNLSHKIIVIPASTLASCIHAVVRGNDAVLA